MIPFSINFLKNYDLVVADFDGTLVDKSLVLSPESINFINYLLDNELHFSIASGRSLFGTISKVCHRLNLKDCQIVAAGSAIFNPQQTKPVWVKQFDQRLAKELISKLLTLKANIGVDTYYGAFTENAHQIDQYGPGVKFNDLKDINYSEINKVVILPNGTPKKAMADVHNLLEAYKNKIHVVNSHSPVGPAYDLTPLSASKYTAALELMKILNIDQARTIGIGDGYNDYPLLTACGYKIAIEGAPKELTEIADLVISREKLFSLSNNK